MRCFYYNIYYIILVEKRPRLAPFTSLNGDSLLDDTGLAFILMSSLLIPFPTQVHDDNSSGNWRDCKWKEDVPPGYREGSLVSKLSP